MFQAHKLERDVKLPPVDYASPRSLDEAIRLLGQTDAKLLSGGQSLMPMLAFRVASCRLLVDLKNVPGLDTITAGAAGVEIGAKVTWRDIERCDRLPACHPLLRIAVSHVAHYQIRNRGTVGGSLAHADPAAELPALAVTCDAEILAAGLHGPRTIRADEFFLSPLVTALAPDEVILALRLPAWHRSRRYGFEEFARRRGDFALAGAIVFYDSDERGRIRDAHVGAFGVADTPLRLDRAEDLLNDAEPNDETFARAAAAGTADIEVHSDIHADGYYRRALLATLIVRALQAASKRAQA